jgi:3-hydroxyisobutyrate dehydrogenase-like beta-hydroxyacid dehydrogenase
MSTAGRPTMIRIVDAVGTRIEVLDCPVSGGRQRAIDGTLTAIVAAPRDLLERMRPLLDIAASKIFVVGVQPGQAGLDAAVMIDAINACTGRNTATSDKFPKSILPRTFDFGGPMGIPAKDLNLFVEASQASRRSCGERPWPTRPCRRLDG